MPCGSGSWKEPEVTLPAVSAPPPRAPSPPLVHMTVSSPALQPDLRIPTLSLPSCLSPSACARVQRSPASSPYALSK